MTKADYVKALEIMLGTDAKELNKMSVKGVESMYYGLLRNAMNSSDMASEFRALKTEVKIKDKRIASLERSLVKLGGKL